MANNDVTTHDLAPLIQENGRPFETWYANFDGASYTIEEMEETFIDQYQGEFDSLTQFAEHLADEMGWFDIAESEFGQASYFDVERFAYDLQCSGEYFWVDGYVFRAI